MRWAKIILIFQAIVTLAIGMAFLFQIAQINDSTLSNIATKLSSTSTEAAELSEELDSIKTKYTVASYLLTIIGLVELIIITRLLS